VDENASLLLVQMAVDHKLRNMIGWSAIFDNNVNNSVQTAYPRIQHGHTIRKVSGDTFLKKYQPIQQILNNTVFIFGYVMFLSFKIAYILISTVLMTI